MAIIRLKSASTRAPTTEVPTFVAVPIMSSKRSMMPLRKLSMAPAQSISMSVRSPDWRLKRASRSSTQEMNWSM